MKILIIKIQNLMILNVNVPNPSILTGAVGAGQFQGSSGIIKKEIEFKNKFENYNNYLIIILFITKSVLSKH